MILKKDRIYLHEVQYREVLQNHTDLVHIIHNYRQSVINVFSLYDKINARGNIVVNPSFPKLIYKLFCKYAIIPYSSICTAFIITI